ncbi:MFS transporter [Specibacter cremeus]|uniref:MFS transporter n=1 Tax=Specibacter cremeus TaxID=1629051 RepID=UPI000F79F3AC|nr:MFS transporter [Specibacter cremeus]
MSQLAAGSGGRTFFGLSRALVWGYVAIAFFMTGDGIEQAFLSNFMVSDLGFSEQQAGTLFTVYGLVVAIAAFASGILADFFGPRRIMAIATVGWIVFHAGFLVFGVQQHDYTMMLLMYAIRAAAYPLFVYGFVVWISYSAPQDKLSSAMGWFWCMYSVGLGLFGSYLPSFTIPVIGQVTTMWLAIGFIVIGGLLAFFMVRGKAPRSDFPKTAAGFGAALKEGVTLPFRNRQFLLGIAMRIINQVSLYAFIVMLPIVFTRDIGFSESTWLQLWGLVYLVTIFTNLMWGVLGDKFGWIRTVRWFGCIGMAVATLLMYFLPLAVGPNPWITAFAVLLFGVGIAAFVPLSAVFPAWAPHSRGAAVSLLNLSAGLSSFVGPLLVTIFWPILGTAGMVVLLAAIYLLGFVLSYFMRVDQNALADYEKSQTVKDPVTA